MHQGGFYSKILNIKVDGKVEKILGDDKVDLLITENVTIKIVKSTIQSLLFNPNTKK